MISENFDQSTNIDQSILNFLLRDFRITPTFKSKALQFSNFVSFCEKNVGVLELEEYARGILSVKNGISVRTMIRLLSKFSGSKITTQRKVIGFLICNDKFVRPQVIFKLNPESISGDKYELDIDSTMLYLQSDLKPYDIKSDTTISDCNA